MKITIDIDTLDDTIRDLTAVLHPDDAPIVMYAILRACDQAGSPEVLEEIARYEAECPGPDHDYT